MLNLTLANGMNTRQGFARAGILATVMVVIISVSMIELAPARNDTISSSSTSVNTCGLESYYVRLAGEVQKDNRFVTASNGSTYVLAYGSNATAETGIEGAKNSTSPPPGTTASGPAPPGGYLVGGTSVYYPPSTSLAFYSYGNSEVTQCPSALGIRSVVGALWVQVPLNPDGSPSLANMSIYYTPGVFSNSTAVGK